MAFLSGIAGPVAQAANEGALTLDAAQAIIRAALDRPAVAA
jgi:hypothetical protein